MTPSCNQPAAVTSPTCSITFTPPIVDHPKDAAIVTAFGYIAHPGFAGGLCIMPHAGFRLSPLCFAKARARPTNLDPPSLTTPSCLISFECWIKSLCLDVAGSSRCHRRRRREGQR